MNNESVPPIDVSSTRPSGLATRLTNVFIAPGEVFAEVKASPVRHSNWLIPALLFVLASWLAAALMFSNSSIKQQVADIQEEAIQKRFQPQIDAGKMTQAQVDQVKAQTTKFAGIGQIVGGFVGPLFQAAITPFWGGFVLWLGGIWIFKQRFEYLKGVEVVGLTLVVLAVGAIVKGLLCAAMGSLFVAPGPILLVKHYDATNPLHNILIALDVFMIWAVLLRAVGLAKLSDVSFAKAASWVVGVWVLLTGGMLALSWGAQKLANSVAGQH